VDQQTCFIPNIRVSLPIPINVFREEGMSLDFLASVGSQTSSRIPLKQACHHTSSFRRHIRREIQRIGKNPLVHGVHIFVVEWGQAGLKDSYQTIAPLGEAQSLTIIS
jgi:hypothetical protein